MRRFTTDNTEGYGWRDLERLNELFEEEAAKSAEFLNSADDQARKSFLDCVAEQTIVGMAQ